MLIEAVLNGDRAPGEHPCIPLVPEKLAESARECVSSGAGAIHFHVRARSLRESLEPEDVALAINAVKAAIPVTPIGVSTGAWIVPLPEVRHRKVAEWTALPNFATVNFHERGAEALAELLLARGVAVEAGLIHARAAEALVASGLAVRCLRIVFEPQEATVAKSLRNVAEMEAVLDRGEVKIPRMLHGVNATAWPILDIAIAKGYDTRMGFEDVLVLPDGSQAPDNAALVAEALRRARKFSAAKYIS